MPKVSWTDIEVHLPHRRQISPDCKLCSAGGAETRAAIGVEGESLPACRAPGAGNHECAQEKLAEYKKYHNDNFTGRVPGASSGRVRLMMIGDRLIFAGSRAGVEEKRAGLCRSTVASRRAA